MGETRVPAAAMTVPGTPDYDLKYFIDSLKTTPHGNRKGNNCQQEFSGVDPLVLFIGGPALFGLF
jgi:hypothetical protein